MNQQQECLIEDILSKKITCPKAAQRLHGSGSRGEKLNIIQCPWYLDSKEHGYCFWLYLIDPDANKEHSLTEIARLLGCSINNVKLVENNAIQKLREIVEDPNF